MPDKIYNFYYHVFYATIGIPKPDQEAVLIRTVGTNENFLAVEDWAHDNMPDGYELSSIEKLYGPMCDLPRNAEDLIVV